MELLTFLETADCGELSVWKSIRRPQSPTQRQHSRGERDTMPGECFGRQTWNGDTVQRLTGKTALVTGSTRGIGRVVAEMLSAEGANLVVTGRRDDDVARAVRELATGGTRVYGFAADLAHFDEAHRVAETVLAAVPQLDILVNNA